VRTLLDAGQDTGARVLTSTPATGLEPRPDGVRAATPSEAFEADVAVIAAGRFTDKVAALANLRVPLRPTRGLLALTSPLADPPRVVVHAPGVHWRPEPDGRLVIQDDETDEMVGPDTPESPELPGCGILLERARRFIPALADARIEAARVGIRPMPEDGYPIVGSVPGTESIYLMVTHSGMTLSAVLGEVAAAELVDGQLDERLAAFRPDRYLSRR
jgi:glycine/D-amino acid oxidase-like deaminating enzyme